MNEAERIVNEYAEMILKISYNFFGNIYDAEDIMQTVLMKLLTIEKTEYVNEKAFVIRVTINTCKNLKASVWFKRVVGFSSKNEPILRQEFFVEDELIFELMKLPISYRNALYLYYYEDMKVSEIAEILHIKPQLVSTHLKRGKEKLKKLLGEGFYEKYMETNI